MATIKVWIEPDNGRFRVRYRLPARPGKRYGRKLDIEPVSRFDTRREANTAADRFRERMLNRAFGKADADTPLQDVYDQWLLDCAAGLANRQGKVIQESTIETYGNSLKYVLDNCRTVGELTNEWVTDYVRRLYGEYQGWTPHRRLTDLKSFCSYLRRKKLIGWDPFEGISIGRPPRRPRFYTDPELQALEAAATALGDLQGLLALRLGYLAALRKSEVVGLEFEDIRPDPYNPGWGVITVWADESKNGKSREVPVPPKVLELVHQLATGKSSGQVLEGIQEKQLEYKWARILAAAGLPPAPWYQKRYKWARQFNTEREECPFHGLRHTYVRIMRENGAEDSDIMNWTGQSLKVMIETYGHITKTAQRSKAREVYERHQNKPLFSGHYRGTLSEIVVAVGKNEKSQETKNVSSRPRLSVDK